MDITQPINGVTLGMIWAAFAVLIMVAGLYILYGQVKKTHRDLQSAKQEKSAQSDQTINGRLEIISQKLDAIDSFMKETNDRFDRDNRRLNALEKQSEDTNRGVKTLCRTQQAHLLHDITGNHVETLKEANEMITEYLTSRS